MIDLMPDQRDLRQGRHDAARPLPLRARSGHRARARRTASRIVQERHRHRFEFNNAYRDGLAEEGLVVSGASPDGRLVEIIELRDHPGSSARSSTPSSRPARTARTRSSATSSAPPLPGWGWGRPAMRRRLPRSRLPRATPEPMSPRAVAARKAAFDRSAYERNLGAFIAQREEELYQHGAGLHDELALGPIYERHASLFSRPAVDALRRLLEGGGPEASHNRALLAVATDGFIEQATSGLTDAIGTAEATAMVVWRGESIPYRAMRNRISEVSGRAEREGAVRLLPGGGGGAEPDAPGALRSDRRPRPRAGLRGLRRADRRRRAASTPSSWEPTCAPLEESETPGLRGAAALPGAHRDRAGRRQPRRPVVPDARQAAGDRPGSWPSHPVGAGIDPPRPGDRAARPARCDAGRGGAPEQVAARLRGRRQRAARRSPGDPAARRVG